MSPTHRSALVIFKVFVVLFHKNHIPLGNDSHLGVLCTRCVVLVFHSHKLHQMLHWMEWQHKSHLFGIGQWVSNPIQWQKCQWNSSHVIKEHMQSNFIESLSAALFKCLPIFLMAVPWELQGLMQNFSHWCTAKEMSGLMF